MAPLKEETPQPAGLSPTLQEAALPVALGGHPRSCETGAEVDQEALISHLSLFIRENKGVKTTGKVSMLLTVWVVLLSPPGLPLVLCPPSPSGVCCCLGLVGLFGGS